MSRPVDEKRPKELRDAIVKYLVKHGLHELSRWPLARALGCTPRVLLYHLGSREAIVEVLAQVGQQQRATYAGAEGASFAESCQNIWKRMSAPDSEQVFRLFFETYGIVLRHPRLYKAFLHNTIEDWLQLATDGLCGKRHQRKQARTVATMALAALRGFMLDLCTTHDRKRVDQAVQFWLRSLDSLVRTRKGAL